jgi:predicted secreted Zn-dependent protease
MKAHIARHARLGCLIVVLAGCATTHPENPAFDSFPAGVSGTTDVVYYDVHGRTAGELVADMRRLGPKSTAGGTFFGETQSPMRWSWRIRNEGVTCSLRDVRVRVASQVTLPRWTPPADTIPGLAAQWQTFLAALQVHEIGHKDISARAAAEIVHKLQALNSSCSSLSDAAHRSTDAIVARSRDEQLRYDAETRHGVTQGAVFPPRRVGLQ